MWALRRSASSASNSSVARPLFIPWRTTAAAARRRISASATRVMTSRAWVAGIVVIAHFTLSSILLMDVWAPVMKTLFTSHPSGTGTMIACLIESETRLAKSRPEASPSPKT